MDHITVNGQAVPVPSNWSDAEIQNFAAGIKSGPDHVTVNGASYAVPSSWTDKSIGDYANAIKLSQPSPMKAQADKNAAALNAADATTQMPSHPYGGAPLVSVHPDAIAASHPVLAATVLAPHAGARNLIDGSAQIGNAQNGRELAGGAHKVITGGMQVLTPTLGAAIVAAPVATGAALLTSAAAGAATNKVAKVLGAPDEYADLASDVVSLLAGGKVAKSSPVIEAAAAKYGARAVENSPAVVDAAKDMALSVFPKLARAGASIFVPGIGKELSVAHMMATGNDLVSKGVAKDFGSAIADLLTKPTYREVLASNAERTANLPWKNIPDATQDASPAFEPIPASQTPSGRVPGGIDNQQRAAELQAALDFANKATVAEKRAAWEASRAKVLADTQTGGIGKAGDSVSAKPVTNIRSEITLPSGRKVGGIQNVNTAPAPVPTAPNVNNLFNGSTLDAAALKTVLSAANENGGAAMKALPADARAAFVKAYTQGDVAGAAEIVQQHTTPAKTAPTSPALDPEVNQKLIQAEQDGSLKALPAEAKTALTQASRDGKSDLANYILKYGRKPSPSELNHFISSERKADVFNEYLTSPEFVENAQRTGASVDPQTYSADPVARQAISDAAFAKRFNDYVRKNKIDVSSLSKAELKDVRTKAGLPRDGYKGTHESAFDILKQRAEGN